MGSFPSGKKAAFSSAKEKDWGVVAGKRPPCLLPKVGSGVLTTDDLPIPDQGTFRERPPRAAARGRGADLTSPVGRGRAAGPRRRVRAIHERAEPVAPRRPRGAGRGSGRDRRASGAAGVRGGGPGGTPRGGAAGQDPAAGAPRSSPGGAGRGPGAATFLSRPQQAALEERGGGSPKEGKAAEESERVL